MGFIDSSYDVTKRDFQRFTGIDREFKQIGGVLLQAAKTGRSAVLSESSY